MSLKLIQSLIILMTLTFSVMNLLANLVTILAVKALRYRMIGPLAMHVCVD